MENILFIDCEASYITAVLLEDGHIAEIYTEYQSALALTGNIYKGRVARILSGLQSAFVDIGGEKMCFWEVGAALDPQSLLTGAAILPHGGIIAKEGDEVMVQILKEAAGNKGPKVTSNISIAGHYCVYLYNLDFVGVSAKITDEPRREHLTALLAGIAPKGRGYIARTSCLNAKDEDILLEAKNLIIEGERLQQRWDASSGITLIRGEVSILYRAVRDMLSQNTKAIYCNNESVTDDLNNMISKDCPYFDGKVHFLGEAADIYEYFGVDGELAHLSDRKVPLQSGGSLVIEKTEALTTIDVNTGSNAGHENREETVYRNNLEAVSEIARQIRIRNIGGIIVIDFVDMAEQSHRESVVNALRTELLKDRAKTNVLEMSEFGLVQMTRRKNGKDLQAVTETECPFCHGLGHIFAPDYIGRNIKTKLKKLFLDPKVTRAAVHVNPHNFNHLVDSDMSSRTRLIDSDSSTPDHKALWYDRTIYIIADWSLHINDYYVVALADWETVPEGTIRL